MEEGGGLRRGWVGEVRIRRIIPYHGIGKDGPRYGVEIAEQPLSRYVISCLYEFYYWRVGWIVRRLEPINRLMHERTCGLCRAARSHGSIEGFIEIDGDFYNVHYEPCALGRTSAASTSIAAGAIESHGSRLTSRSITASRKAGARCAGLREDGCSAGESRTREPTMAIEGEASVSEDLF